MPQTTATLASLSRRFEGRPTLPDSTDVTQELSHLRTPSWTDFQQRDLNELTTAVRRSLARQRMRAAYDSGQLWRTLGLPIDGDLTVTEQSDQYRAQLRSGVLVLDAGGQLIEQRTNEVIVRLAGIECRARQEKADELYGVVSVLGPANQHLSETRFPGTGTITMGPAGNRLLPFAAELYRGPIEDLYLVVSLIENDSGDPDVVSRSIIERLRRLSESVLSAAGLPAEAVAQSQSIDEDLITGLGFLLGEVAGIGDDPYDAVSKFIRWQDLMAAIGKGLPAHRASRADDSRVIDRYTHAVDLSGTDDGGDRGSYRFFFDVAVQTTVTT